MTTTDVKCSDCACKYQTYSNTPTSDACKMCGSVGTLEIADEFRKRQQCVCANCGTTDKLTWRSMHNGCSCGGKVVPLFAVYDTPEPFTVPSERYQWWNDADLLAEARRQHTGERGPSGTTTENTTDRVETTHDYSEKQERAEKVESWFDDKIEKWNNLFS